MPFIGNTPDVNFTSFAKQDLTGVTGSPAKRGYTLSHAVANANEIEVFVNNVRQEPTEAYTVSGTGLTMTGDVETSDDFYIIFLGKAIQTTVPPDGSVSTAKIADGSVTSAKLDTNIAIGGKLTISTSDSGATPSVHSDDLFVEGSGNSGITVGSATNGFGNLRFADSGGSDQGIVQYDHANDAMKFFSNGSERMHINSSGQVAIGTSSPDGLLTLEGSDNPLARFTHTQNADESLLILKHEYAQGSQTASMIVFRNSVGNERGSIKTNGTATAYNTSSDYRLKENVTYNFDATTRLKQLKPCRFNFIEDADNTIDGFLAHEVSSIVPEAITGEKDAVNEDGSIKLQSIDQSKLIPLLVKTIQELEARITALENK